MLSLYHLRPVPEEMDGRTDEEKASPDYKPYSSVWYEIDRSQMYPSARLLMDAGFDSEAAALEMLRICLSPQSLSLNRRLLTDDTNSTEVLHRIF